MEPNEERQGNDKKAERLAKRRERNDNVCSRRLLRKEKLAWESVEKHGKKRLLKRKVSKGLSSQPLCTNTLVFTTLCTYVGYVAIQVEV
jgi:hypothetical protein